MRAPPTTSFRRDDGAAAGRLPTLQDVPPAPRRPSRQARRVVFGYGGGQGIFVVVGVAFVVIGTVLAAGLTFGLGYVGLVVLPFPLLGAGIVAFAVRSNRREIRAFTRGRPILARVTFRGVDESVDFNGRHPFMLRWEFRTENGDVHEGSLTSMKLLELEPFGAAEEVVVLYDPADPRANTLFIP